MSCPLEHGHGVPWWAFGTVSTMSDSDTMRLPRLGPDTMQLPPALLEDSLLNLIAAI